MKIRLKEQKQTYKLLNEISGKNKAKTDIPFLDKLPQCDVDKNLQIAEALNDHFVNIAGKITQNIPRSAPPDFKSVDYSMYLSVITEN